MSVCAAVRRLLEGFSDWTLAEILRHNRRTAIPRKGGIYEFGVKINGIIYAFYLGKSDYDLCMRLGDYARLNGPLGPKHELKKMAVFTDFQERGHEIFFRWARVREDEGRGYRGGSLER